MSDRLTLANALASAIEEAGIPRDKAERVATVIFDAIHHNVVTKADVEASTAALKADAQALRVELRADAQALIAALRDTASKIELTGVRSELAGLRGEMVSVERRLLRRVGGLIVVLIVVVTGVLFAALRYWLPLAWLP
jgi:hypothetical protein